MIWYAVSVLLLILIAVLFPDWRDGVLAVALLTIITPALGVSMVTVLAVVDHPSFPVIIRLLRAAQALGSGDYQTARELMEQARQQKQERQEQKQREQEQPKQEQPKQQEPKQQERGEPEDKIRIIGLDPSFEHLFQ